MTGENERIERDEMVEFKSHVGNTIVLPSQWSVEDNGANLEISSPDGAAQIYVYTYTTEGSGSLADFQKTMLSDFQGGWEFSDWEGIEIGGLAAQKRHLDAKDDSTPAFRIYVLQNGECYHALFITAPPTIMFLNGDFYEEIVTTFRGIAAIRR